MKGTPKHGVRCPANLWKEAAGQAASDDTNLSQVIRALLRAYVADPDAVRPLITAHPDPDQTARGEVTP